MMRQDANTWTGGQYSLLRACIGLVLLPHTAGLIVGNLHSVGPKGLSLLSIPIVFALLLVGYVALILGLWGRRAAFALATCVGFFTAFFPTANVEPQILAVSLLALHTQTPRAPFGSVLAQGRLDPAGSWRMPPWTYGAAWLILCGTVVIWCMATFATMEAEWSVHQILPALGLLGVLGAGNSRLRPAMWVFLIGWNLARYSIEPKLGIENFGPILLLHGFTFAPRWIPRAKRDLEMYYDGDCAICQGVVRFVLAEDRHASIRLAPLDSDARRQRIPDATFKKLPDSVIVRHDDILWLKSQAIEETLRNVGGLWRGLALVLRVLPRRPLNWTYDIIARWRKRLLNPVSVCPVLPPHLRDRFL